jgi:UDP-N-acetyl-D-glucosamine dehydrogenase
MPSSRPSPPKTLGVVGLGYVGLPLSLTFCEAGLSVIGFEIDPAKPKALAKGQTYLEAVTPFLAIYH